MEIISNSNMFVSIRKFFGFVMPGFSWVIFIYFLFSKEINESVQNLQILQDKALLYAVIILISYVIGALNIQIAFRILCLFGDKIDSFVTWIKAWQWPCRFFSFLSERFHVFDLYTLDEEIKEEMRLLEEKFQMLNSSGIEEKIKRIRHYGPWYCKMYILANSSSLSREILEIEGDLNFHAGMFLPLLVLGINFSTSLFGMMLILVSVFFALRFQHQRHHEIQSIFEAFITLHEGLILPEKSR